MARSQESASIRMLPHDDEAERAVLGTLLLNPEGSWDVVSPILDPSDFYHPAHQVIYQGICDLVNLKQMNTFDGKILVDHLQKEGLLEKAGGIGYIAQITNSTIIAAHVRQYTEIIRESSKRRVLYTVTGKLQEDSLNPSENIDDALEKSSKDLSELLLKGMRENSEEYSLGAALSRTYKEINAKIEGTAESDRLETDFGILDKYTNGGFAKEEYVIIAARPSIGKTAFALSLMYNMIRKNTKVGFFSLEMPSSSIIKRLLAIDSKVDLTKIIKGELIGDDFDRVQNTVFKLYEKKDNLYIVDVPNITLTELRTKARQLVKEHGIQCIVIDYIGLITPPSNMGGSKKFEQVGEISKALKQLARELKIPVVVLCQVGRDSEEQAPLLSNLRDSGSIEQDADLVCFLHRKRNPTEEEKQRNQKDAQGRAVIQVTKFIVAKNRNGEVGEFKIAYNGPITYYGDIAQDAEFIDYEQKVPQKRS